MRKESTISFMHRGFISMLAILAALLTSCSSDGDFADTIGSNNGHVRTGELVANAEPKQMIDEGTRSSLSYAGGTLNFAWEAGDKLTVFAKNNDESTMQYTLKSGANTTKAGFTSTDFALTDNKTYIALSKIEGNGGGSGTRIPDQRNITIDYSGQVQRGNASPAHLGKYDFMAAATTVKPEEEAHFSFQHIGATMRIIAMYKSGYEAFTNIRFHQLEIYDSENSFRQPQRNFSLETGMQPDNTYKVVWPEQTITSTDRFSIDLQDVSNSELGVQPISAFVEGGTNSYNDLVVYAEVPPTDFRGKTMGIILHGKDGSGNPVTYNGTHAGVNLEAGKAYNLYFVSEPTRDYTITLKLNHLWQHGAEKSVNTRTTGDPGYDKEYGLPAHVYYIFCVAGKVRTVQHLGDTEAELKAVNSFTTSTTEGVDWVTTSDKTVSTYKTANLKFSVQPGEATATKHLYVVASKEALTLSVSDQDDEATVVRALTYDITGTDKQIFMRDLYSTPYESDATFVGNITDPVQDVFLYHTAAKVDLQWNSETPMTPTTHKIQVTGVQSTGLSLFKPTTNSGSGTYSVSTDVTTKTWYNGRQVYYLPQFSDNKYNVTIGPKVYDGGASPHYSKYHFTDVSTDGGFTSWYRALIKQ